MENEEGRKGEEQNLPKPSDFIYSSSRDTGSYSILGSISNLNKLFIK